MVPFDRVHTISHWHSIANMALSIIVSELRVLEIWVWGCSRLSKRHHSHSIDHRIGLSMCMDREIQEMQ